VKACELHSLPGLTEWLGAFLCHLVNVELILPLTLPLGEGA